MPSYGEYAADLEHGLEWSKLTLRHQWERHSAFATPPPRNRRLLFRIFAGLLSIVAATIVLSTIVYTAKTSRSHVQPLQFRRRRLNQRSARVLTLGGPSTRGELLHDEHMAYPWLLSSQVHNAAKFASGASLASVCTQSIVGDATMYDLIVLEYAESDAEWSASLEYLATRLRKRFPSAEIVFVDLPNPRPFGVHRQRADGQREWLSFQEWRQQHSSLEWNSDEFNSALTKENWTLRPDEHSFSSLDLEDIATKVNGRVVWMEEFGSNPASTVSKLFEYGGEKEPSYILSEEGHAQIARLIQSSVHEPSLLARPDRNRLGNWGIGDSCQFWYNTGDTAMATTNLKFERFSDKKKFSLAVPNEGGSLSVQNPFEESRLLYLSYMTTSTAHANKIYPKCMVQLNGKDSVILDPFHDDHSDSRHTLRTAAVGKIPPGSVATIQLRPMEYTRQPFRLVGASFLAIDALTPALSIDLYSERVRVQSSGVPSEFD